MRPVDRFLQFAGELDALRLTTGERGGGLTEADVAETDVVQRLQVTGDRRDRLEECMASSIGMFRTSAMDLPL